MEEQGIFRSGFFSNLWNKVRNLRKPFHPATPSISNPTGAALLETPDDPEKTSMQRRVDELEQRLAVLEAERDLTGTAALKPVKEIWKPALLVIATVILAVIPSAWVVWHRWMSYELIPILPVGVPTLGTCL